jgi:TfoX/Sxy family transcriptional regulator of competence genes
MATDPSFAAYVAEQGQGAGDVVVKRMFGEYGVYVDGAFVGVLCDDQCFLKPTDAARALLDAVDLAPPYPGAKPHLRLGAELEDPARFARLLAATAGALPPAKPKKPRAKKAATGGR